MFRFPWGDFHSLNLGWFLQKFNELSEDWATAEAGIDGALDAEIQKAEDALTDVFAARDAAAASASAANSSALNASQSSLASTDARDKSRAARDAAQQAATNAAGSATAAGNAATNAAASATAAGNSATAAGNSATAAGNSATAAAASETAAGNSATAAAASETAAGQSAEDAEDAAASVEASAQQITTNTNDVTKLKESVNIITDASITSALINNTIGNATGGGLTVSQKGDILTVNGTSTATQGQAATKVALTGKTLAWNGATPEEALTYPLKLIAGHTYRLSVKNISGSFEKNDGTGNCRYRAYTPDETFICDAYHLYGSEYTFNDFVSDGRPIRLVVMLPRLSTYTDAVFAFEIKDITQKTWCDERKINWLGDSIVAGEDFDEIVSTYLNLSETDYGVAGSTIALNEDGSDTRNACCARYANMTDDADIIAVSAGTNDFEYAWCPIGTINDADDGTSNNTFYGALKALCKGLIVKYPQKTIFFTTPIKRGQPFRNGDGGEYTADGITLTPFSRNKYGKTLQDYANIIKEVCALYSIPVLDLYSESMLNPHISTQRNLFDSDLTHPNNNGRKIMARRVCGWVNQLSFNIL